MPQEDARGASRKRLSFPSRLAFRSAFLLLLLHATAAAQQPVVLPFTCGSDGFYPNATIYLDAASGAIAAAPTGPDPFILWDGAIDGDQLDEFAMQISVTDAPQESFTCALFWFSDGGHGRAPFTLNSGAQLVRFNAPDSQTSGAGQWDANVYRIRLDLPDALHTPFVDAGTVFTIDWLAISDDPAFVPAPDYGSSDCVNFNVKDYGAVGDGVADDSHAVGLSVAAAASAAPGTRVYFPPGVYRLGGLGGVAGYAVEVYNCRGLTIEGDEATIIITEPDHGAFLLRGVEDCIVRGITIDYDPLPFTQGTIVAVNPSAQTFDLALQDGYPSLNESYFASASGPWGMIFDPTERHLKEGTPSHVWMASWQHLSGEPGRVFRLTPSYGGNVNYMTPGDRFVQLARASGSGVHLFDARNCRVEDVTVHAGPSLAAANVQAEGTVYKHFRVEVKPGTDRLISTDADGVHCQDNRVGPLIEDCFFEGMADDAFNIYAIPNPLLAIHSSTDVAITSKAPILVGDSITIQAPVSGLFRGSATVTGVQYGAGQYRVQFAPAIANMRSAETTGSPDFLINLSCAGPGFTLRNNTMQWHRRHGMLVQGVDGLIEGNYIDHVSSLGIVIVNSPGWPEGPGPRMLTVRNNTVTGVAYDTNGNTRSGAAIRIMGQDNGYNLADGPTLESIVLSGNTIQDWGKTAIYAGAVRRLSLIDNIIGPSEPAAASDPVGLFLQRCEDVVIHDLHIDDPTRSDLRAGIEVDAGMVSGSVSLSGYTPDLDAGVPEVLDPAGAIVEQLALPDTDGDGLDDVDEVTHGTMATRTDSDGDGWSDYEERYFGTDPSDAGNVPADLCVDFGWAGSERGTFAEPFSTLAAAQAALTPGQRIGIKSAGTASVVEGVRLTKAMHLRRISNTVVLPGSPLLALLEAMRKVDKETGATFPAPVKTTVPEASGIASPGKSEPKAALVHESALPVRRDFDGLRVLHTDEPLAMRLRHADGTDVASIRVTELPGGTLLPHAVQPASERIEDGFWITLDPVGGEWNTGGLAVLVQANGLTGGPTHSVVERFRVQVPPGDSGVSPVWQPQPGRDYVPLMEENVGLVKVVRHAPVPNEPTPGSGPVYALQPDRVYGSPQRVWVPVSSELSPEGVDVFYCLQKETTAPRWCPAESVAGWAVPGSVLHLRLNDGRRAYLGLLVRHAGIFKLSHP